MPNLIYVGDDTSHGGKVLTGSSRITLDGRGAARKTDRVSCPKCGENEIGEGNEHILHGNKTRCGAILLASNGTTGSA